MSLKIVEILGTNFREYKLPEHKNLEYLWLLNLKNQISKDYYKNKVLYLTWSNKVFKKSYGKYYTVDLLYYLRTSAIQGAIKYI